MRRMTNQQRWHLGFVMMACLAYFGASALAPRAQNADSAQHFSMVLVLVVGLTVIGLLILTWAFGFYAWLQLDRYTRSLPDGSGRRAFGQMTQGVRFLVGGLILSSLISATKPYYAGDVGLAAVVTQINYYIIIIFPFLGFLWLRIGSRRLAIPGQAIMTARAKLITVGPPVVLLASFYVFLSATNATPDAEILLSGPTGFLVLPANILLVVGSWILGLLAALNIERATHGGEGASHAQPLVKLYNGILTTTGGFIILDALMSLGTTRLSALPVAIIVFLIYAFIGVVALGFLIVALGARELLATTQKAAARL